MTLPASNNKEPSKLNKLVSGKTDQPSVQSRLPRAARVGTSASKVTPATSGFDASASPVPPSKPRREYSRIGPIFWTIASVISLLVNIGTVVALIVVVQLLGGTKATLAFAQGQANGLLGGLYNNFVKMDAASIKTTIHVEKDIPVQFTLNVSGATDVTLSSGTLTAPSGTFSVSGNWLRSSGTFSPGASTVTFTDPGTQTVNSGGSSFNNICK